MKPHCFLHQHLLLIWCITSTLFISLALCRKSSSSSSQLCNFEDMVYIDGPEPHSGCYPKAGLGRECSFSLQCSSLNSNTFCGYNPTFTGNQAALKVCLCDEGYSNAESTYECSAVRNCTVAAGNAHHHSSFENYHQADCGEWQFCRLGVCHCKAAYLAFNESGHCVPVQTSSDESSAECSEPEQIFLKEPANRRGCYPRVNLLEECQFSGQCNRRSKNTGNGTMVADAFCGWSSLNTKNPICLCPEGYRPGNSSSTEEQLNSNQQQCVPIRQCTRSGVGLEQADCGPEQFCRNNLCLCKPDYDYDPVKGACVRPIWGYGDGEEDDDDDDGYYIEPQKPKRWYNKPAWIVFIVAFLALIFFLGYAILLYQTRKEEDRLEMKRNNRRRDSKEYDDKLEEEEAEISQKLKDDVSENSKSREEEDEDDKLSVHKKYFESEV